jgi:hypothetical protein
MWPVQFPPIKRPMVVLRLTQGEAIMSQMIPRSHPRAAYRAPIKYAVFNSNQFRSALTCDFSEGGFCYEVDRELTPEEDVCIVMENYAPGRSGPEGYHSYLARIRWTQLLSENGVQRHAAGVQIVARSHKILATDAQMPIRICDLCNTCVAQHRIIQTASHAQICEQCAKHLNKISSEKVRRCVERFLMGNVI